MILETLEKHNFFSRAVIVFICYMLWEVTFRTFDLVDTLDGRGRETVHIVSIGGMVQTTMTLLMGYVFKAYTDYRKLQNHERRPRNGKEDITNSNL